MKTIIHVTPAAAKHVHALVAEKREAEAPQNIGLRLAIEQGGCAGLQYVMTLSTPQKDDLTFIQDEATVFIDAQSADKLANCTLDYEEGLTGGGFRIINPQAVRSCGCGTSFEPKEKKSRE